MALRTLALVFALVALAGAGAGARRLADDDFHFAQCNDDPVFSVSDVAISPNPAVHGQDINVSLTGTNKEEVTAATLSVTIYYRGWPVQRQSRDICSSERPVTPACPFMPGNLTITSSDYVPAIAPPGPYSMRMQAWDQNSTAVMCIDIWFRVVTAPSAAAGGGAAPRALWRLLQRWWQRGWRADAGGAPAAVAASQQGQAQRQQGQAQQAQAQQQAQRQAQQAQQKQQWQDPADAKGRPVKRMWERQV